MKKWIALLLLVFMCFSLVACGSDTSATSNTATTPTTFAPDDSTVETEAEPEQDDSTVETEAEPEQEVICISLGDTIENDKFRMTFESMEILDEYKYKTSEYSSSSLYVEDGYKLLLVRGHMENTSTSAISDSSFVRTATVNGEYVVTDYDVRMNFVRDKYFEIDPYTEIEYCLYINIPEKLAEKFETAEFTLAFNDDMSLPVTTWNPDGTKSTPMDNTYALVGGLGAADANGTGSQLSTSAEPSNTEINIGDVISTEDFEFTLNNVELTYELKPSNTNSVYTSYKAPDGKVYIHVDGSYYNKAKKDVCIRDLFIPSADYDNGYTYDGFAVVDKDDNSFTWASSYVICTPLETCHYHGLIECPKAVDGSDASLVIYMEIGGVTYTYTIR